MTEKLKFTLKSWLPVTAVTISLCYLTQFAASCLGIDLPDQANIEMVRRAAGWNWGFAFLCLQILVIMPALEECVFRLPMRWLRAPAWSVLSAALFSAAHYLAQPWPDAAFLALFFFGLAQCWLYRRTGSLCCAMLNHALFNLTNLILLFLV